MLVAQCALRPPSPKVSVPREAQKNHPPSRADECRLQEEAAQSLQVVLDCRAVLNGILDSCFARRLHKRCNFPRYRSIGWASLRGFRAPRRASIIWRRSLSSSAPASQDPRGMLLAAFPTAPACPGHSNAPGDSDCVSPSDARCRTSRSPSYLARVERFLAGSLSNMPLRRAG